MNGVQENLYDKERKIEMNIVEDEQIHTNQYGLPEQPEIKFNSDLTRSTEM